MTTPIGDIMEFACKHPDYWSLLVPGEDPEELELLDEDRKRAFEAAREEVRRKVTALIRACHRVLQEKAAGETEPMRSRLESVFSRKPSQTSFNKGGSYWNLLKGKGKQSWANVYFWEVTHPDGPETIELVFTTESSKNRAPLIHEVYERRFPDGFGSSEKHGWVGAALSAERTVEDTARSLIEQGWPAMVECIHVIEASANDD